MTLWKSAVRSAHSCFSKAILLITLPGLFAGCAKRLPDPQVIRNPLRTEAALSETPVPTGVPVASPTVTPSATLIIPTPTAEAIRYDVPILSQDGLMLNNAPTGVGCVPACIEMITSWWHGISDEYPILSAQEVIDRNAEQGLYIAGRGMSSQSAADELAELGYVHHMELNSSKEDLLKVFAKHGPVGLLVKTNWTPGTMNHIVVLTGYDPAEDIVTVNDPYYGRAVSWSWNAFDGIWGLNYAGDSDYTGSVVRRVWFTIYPQHYTES